MQGGNPNQRPIAPPQLMRSRHMPGRVNPGGFGIERLLGGVAQPLKINSIPGFGRVTIDPFVQAEILRRRTSGLPPVGEKVRF